MERCKLFVLLYIHSFFYVMFRQHYLNSLRCGLEHKLVNVLELSFVLNLAAVASIKLTFTDWIFSPYETSMSKVSSRKIVTMYRRLITRDSGTQEGGG
jgi:hypothetical protein